MKKKHLKVFQDINKSIPTELTSRVIKKVDRYELHKKVMDKALEDPEFPEEKKEIYRNLRAAGHLDVQDEVEDEEVQAKIYEYIKGEIIKAVNAGNLPKYMLKELTKVTKVTTKKVK